MTIAYVPRRIRGAGRSPGQSRNSRPRCCRRTRQSWGVHSEYDRLEKIEAAVSELEPEEYQRFVEWFRAREQARWDEQLDGDSAGGKLDFLFDEADRDAAEGRLREWPLQKEIGRKSPLLGPVPFSGAN